MHASVCASLHRAKLGYAERRPSRSATCRLSLLLIGIVQCHRTSPSRWHVVLLPTIICTWIKYFTSNRSKTQIDKVRNQKFLHILTPATELQTRRILSLARMMAS